MHREADPQLDLRVSRVTSDRPSNPPIEEPLEVRERSENGAKIASYVSPFAFPGESEKGNESETIRVRP